MFHVFFNYVFDIMSECLKRNKNHLAIQVHHSVLELLFLVYFSYTVFLYSSTCNKRISFKEQHVYQDFLSLIFVTSLQKFIWFIRFAVFCVHKYCFHGYILTITVQSCLLFYPQIPINIFMPIKIKVIRFAISYRNHIFPMIIMT